jgi:hypothetical protein
MSKSLETKLRELPGVSVRGQWHVQLKALLAFLKEQQSKEPEPPAVPRRAQSKADDGE